MISLPIYFQNNCTRLNMINIYWQLVSALCFFRTVSGLMDSRGLLSCIWMRHFYRVTQWRTRGWQVATVQIINQDQSKQNENPTWVHLRNNMVGFKKKNHAKYVTAWLNKHFKLSLWINFWRTELQHTKLNTVRQMLHMLYCVQGLGLNVQKQDDNFGDLGCIS